MQCISEELGRPEEYKGFIKILQDGKEASQVMAYVYTLYIYIYVWTECKTEEYNGCVQIAQHEKDSLHVMSCVHVRNAYTLMYI